MYNKKNARDMCIGPRIIADLRIFFFQIQIEKKEGSNDTIQ